MQENIDIDDKYSYKITSPPSILPPMTIKYKGPSWLLMTQLMVTLDEWSKYVFGFWWPTDGRTYELTTLLWLKICIQKLPIIASHALVGIVCIVYGVLSVLHDWMTACHTVSINTTADAGLVITSQFQIIWPHYFMLHCLTTHKYLGTGGSHQILGHKHSKYQAEGNWPKIAQEK